MMRWVFLTSAHLERIDMSGDHNQYQKPASQCERCGEVNPAEIHTCTPQVCCQEYETCTRPCTPRGREQTKREWQGLTDEDKKAIYEQADIEGWHDRPLLEAVETKLKEKNHG
jgi:hypothetical protein